MNFSQLYKMQLDLDKSINEKHNTNYNNTLTKRVMAFIVELGEFANETRCFKYWSVKGPSPKSVCLEEYIDGVHFILSIGLAIDFDINYEFNPIDTNLEFTECFLKVYELTSIFNNNRTKENYINLFNHFLTLGSYLDFSYEDIIKGYYLKNKINYDRQENNY